MIKEVEFGFDGRKVGLFPAQVCTRCGEEVFDEATSQAIEDECKKQGVWGKKSKILTEQT